MEPRVNVVWCFVIPHILTAVQRKEFADCCVDSEFCSEDQACFGPPFVGSSEFGTVLLGNGEEFGDSVDPIRIEGEGILALLK